MLLGGWECDEGGGLAAGDPVLRDRIPLGVGEEGAQYMLQPVHERSDGAQVTAADTDGGGLLLDAGAPHQGVRRVERLGAEGRRLPVDDGPDALVGVVDGSDRSHNQGQRLVVGGADVNRDRCEGHSVPSLLPIGLLVEVLLVISHDLSFTILP